MERIRITEPTRALRLGIRAEAGEVVKATEAEAALGISEGWAEAVELLEPAPKPPGKPRGRPKAAG